MHILPWRRASRARHAPVAASVPGPIGSSAPPAAFEAFRVRSCDGHAWCVRAADGVVAQEAVDGEPEPALILLRLPSLPHLALLVGAGDTGAICIEGDGLRAPVLSVVLRRLDAEGRVAIRHPLAELHACSLPPGAAPGGIVRIDREPVGGWEWHALEPVPGAALAPSVAAWLETAVAPLAASLDAPSLLRWLRESPPELIGALGAALVRLARPEVLGALGAAIAAEPPLALRLAAAWGGVDPLALTLPNLAAWRSGRAPRARIEVGAEAAALLPPDGTAAAPPDGVVRHLVRAARASVAPVETVALVACLRDEGILLLDWIAHHRAIGIRRFFVYSGGVEDGAEALLARLAEAGALCWLPAGLAPIATERLAPAHARLCLPDLLEARWAAAIGLDEVVAEDFPGALAARLELAERRGADRLALGRRIAAPARILDETVLACASHSASPGPGAVEMARTSAGPGGSLDAEAGPVCVLRRAVRSLPELAAAMPGAVPSGSVDGEWSALLAAPAAAERGSSALPAGTVAAREALLALPGVREAQAAVEGAFRRRSAAGMRAMLAAPAGDGLVGDRLGRLRPLLEAGLARLGDGSGVAVEHLADRAAERA